MAISEVTKIQVAGQRSQLETLNRKDKEDIKSHEVAIAQIRENIRRREEIIAALAKDIPEPMPVVVISEAT